MAQAGCRAVGCVVCAVRWRWCAARLSTRENRRFQPLFKTCQRERLVNITTSRSSHHHATIGGAGGVPRLCRRSQAVARYDAWPRRRSGRTRSGKWSSDGSWRVPLRISAPRSIRRRSNRPQPNCECSWNCALARLADLYSAQAKLAEPP